MAGKIFKINQIDFNAFKKIFYMFIASRICIFLIAYLSSLEILKNKHFGNPADLLQLFYHWDSGWWISLVHGSYYHVPGSTSNVGFLPLYPLLVKCFTYLFGHELSTVLIISYTISNLALLFSCFYLYKLIRIDYDNDISMKAVMLLLITPLSFFFSIFYAEGLFVLLCIACFYHAREKQWLICSIFGLLASVTKVLGVILLIPALLEYLNIKILAKKPYFIHDKIKYDLLYLSMIPAGLIAYMIYLFARFNDALAFMHVQSAWHRSFTSIFTTLQSARLYSTFYDCLFYGAILLMLISIIAMIYFKVRHSYIIYSIIIFYIYMSASLLESIPRYVASIFPLYLGLALISKKYDFINHFLIIFFIMMLALLTIMFTNGYWLT